MKAEEFHVLTVELEKLTPHQRSIQVGRLHKIGGVSRNPRKFRHAKSARPHRVLEENFSY